jgi:hypothetical protein
MIKTLWRNLVAPRTMRVIFARLTPEMHRIAAAEAEEVTGPIRRDLTSLREVADGYPAVLERLGKLEDLVATLEAQARDQKPWLHNLHVMPIDMHPKIDGPFMEHSTCSAADFLRPRFAELSHRLGVNLAYQRKLWEWVYILHHAERTGAIGPGKRGLGFAVGLEPLPSAFAAMGASITASDAPPELGEQHGWRQTGQHAAQLLELHKPKLIDRESFLERVSFEPCDMTAIGDGLRNYDFCWSSCSFEHLGTIKTGLDFVVESVERCLKPGGVAVHTTEFNMSSDTDTVEEGPTVLYRQSDIHRLIQRLVACGHVVEPFSIAPDTHVLDSYVDTPPYSQPHLRLKLMGYVTTSVGLVITKRC